MKIFKINNDLEVWCEWVKTRNAFKHTASLRRNGQEIESVKICYLNRTWESYEFESVLVKLLNKAEPRLSSKEIKEFRNMIDNGGNQDSQDFKTIAMVAKMGEVFGTTQKEKNDWKARMLKAGLEGKGLTMPEDWDSLSEDEKEERLNKVIEVIK